VPADQLSPPQPRDLAVSPLLRFESATAEVLGRGLRRRERATLYVLAALIVVVIIFISVMKLDRIVKAPGRLLPIAGTLTVQPMEKAIIKQILVKVGDAVKKGQVLAICDPTFAVANFTQLQQKIESLEAQVRRMQAEDASAAELPAPANSYDAMQASIFKQRSVEFNAGVSDFDQRINSAEAQVRGLRQSIPDLEARLKLARQMESMNKGLVTDGYVSQLEFMASTDKRVQLETTLSTSASQLDSTEHLLESLKQQRAQFIEQRREQNLNNLASAKDELDAAQQEFAKSRRMSELVNLVAPEDAIVVKIPSLTSGAIAPETTPLFSLVPVNAPLEVGIRIDSQDIGFVKVGDPVTIKFDAYKFLEHGTGTGVIKTISEDSFTQASDQDAVTDLGGAKNGANGGGGDAEGGPFFDARVTIKSIKLHDLPPNFRVSPGMTVQADVVVGRRTIMWYLLGSALRSGSEAMREP
jgi:HlyD family type I secretion membrane fusion protein